MRIHYKIMTYISHDRYFWRRLSTYNFVPEMNIIFMRFNNINQSKLLVHVMYIHELHYSMTSLLINFQVKSFLIVCYYIIPYLSRRTLLISKMQVVTFMNEENNLYHKGIKQPCRVCIDSVKQLQWCPKPQRESRN